MPPLTTARVFPPDLAAVSALPGADTVELTILIPCLNEAETLGICIRKARKFLSDADVVGEVLVADNGSTDGSQAIAERLGARVINVPDRGYGAALLGGLAVARGAFVIMGDADDSYDFGCLDDFLHRLRAGDDLVMGNRFKGGITPKAMPFLHRYLGNPFLSFLGRLFFKIPVGDFHCGLRGFNTAKIRALAISSTGMEFASEMILRARFGNLRISEVPTTLRPAGRSRPPHLRTWRDGWRHLKLLLIHSPRWLFLTPGLILLSAGAVGSARLFFGPVSLGAINLDFNSYVFANMLVIVGAQITTFGAVASVYAVSSGLIAGSRSASLFARETTPDNMVQMALALALVSAAAFGYALMIWAQTEFGPLHDSRVPRLMVASMTFIVLALQMFFSGFLLGVLTIPRQRA